MVSSRKGFTLIELIIVVIIIGILAAIAAPMMQGNVARARRSEAVAACGALRTAVRMYLAENPAVVAYTRADLLGIVGAADLNGSVYTNANYMANSVRIGATSVAGAGWVNMDTTTGAVTEG